MDPRTKRELFIVIGFVAEIFLFVESGVLSVFTPKLSAGFFLLGVFVALVVGKKIGQESVIRFKEKNKGKGKGGM